MFVSLGYTNIPFGDSSLRTFSKKRYRYVGREKDLESGLYYYGARYYCAWTCRFISVDPLAAQYEQLTPYNYADNNPVNDYDIDGMQDNDTSNSAGTGGGAEPAQNRGEGVQQSGAGENIDTNTINTGDLEELRNSFEAPTVSENPTGGTIKQSLPNVENIGGKPPILALPPPNHPSRFTPLEKPALQKEQWERYSSVGEFSGFTQCAASAARACYNANPKAKPLDGWAINQVYISGDPALKKYKQPTEASKTLALELVHLSLEQGLPVMVGVDYKPGGVEDDFTDHYVVIYDRGIDELGHPYFKYAENNRGTAEEGMSDELRFYLYPDGTLNELPPYQVDDSGYKGRTVTGVRLNTFIKNEYNNRK